jgi:hypothetical protein
MGLPMSLKFHVGERTRCPSVQRRCSAMPNTPRGGIGDTEAIRADQNPLADTSQSRELKIDTEEFREISEAQAPLLSPFHPGQFA